MSVYKVKTGHDVVLGSLVDMNPQPDPGPGIRVTQRHYAASGAVDDQGEYIELHWSALEDTSAYTTLITQFGLNTAKTADVTVYVRNDLWGWVRKNGLAIRPLVGEGVTWGDRQSRPLDITILVRNLEDAA